MISGLKTNFAAEFLRSRGYQFVYFPSGFSVTDNINPDVWASPSGKANTGSNTRAAASEFHLLLLKTTLGRLLVQATDQKVDLSDDGMTSVLNQSFDERRTRVEYTFEHLPDYAQNSSSDFVFSHIVLPHNPYLYDADGTPLQYDGKEYLLGDKTDSQRNIALYNAQLQYTNKRVLEVIDRIQKNAARPVVIIVQGDHGHDTFFEWDTPTPSGVRLRSSILNAIYFPTGDYGKLYPSITSVNTFRVVFNQFFGTRYPLLPDVTFVHPRPDPNPLRSVQQFTPFEEFVQQFSDQADDQFLLR
jgi:hypothetical protein